MRHVSIVGFLFLVASSALASDAEKIRAFLAVPLETRLEGALDTSDRRYLGVYGYSLEVPGVPASEVPHPEGTVLAIPGTSDDGDLDLNDRARAYAAEYNRLLRSRTSLPK